jgi:hypothetical protein
MTGALRHYIKSYAALAQPLEDCKMLLLKGSPLQGRPRKQYALDKLVNQPSSAELTAFRNLQDAFADDLFLAHHDSSRQTYAELDASKERGHGCIIYHIK